MLAEGFYTPTDIYADASKSIELGRFRTEGAVFRGEATVERIELAEQAPNFVFMKGALLDSASQIIEGDGLWRILTN